VSKTLPFFKWKLEQTNNKTESIALTAKANQNTQNTKENKWPPY